MSIDQTINEAAKPFSDFLSSIIFYAIPIVDGVSLPVILLVLVSIALFSTIYFNFINLRYFRYAFGLTSGRIKHKEDESDAGQISSFQALSTALSGTVGLGNIAGVAIAISIGGIGATFWMIVMGFLSMSTKFIEGTLGVAYRIHNKEGGVSGGPMYYLRDGLKEIGLPKLGLILAVIFSICSVGGAIGAGNMFQVNQVHQQLINVTGGIENSYWADKGWLFGIGMSALVGFVIIGGIQSIASVASKIVPLMVFIYVGAGLYVIVVNYVDIPTGFMSIFDAAFSMEAGIGGLIGAVIQGVRRAAFSNEAGIGSAAVTHAVAKSAYPASQGMVAMLGAFIDTVVICTITALVIILSGIPLENNGVIEGVSLTSRAFETAIPGYSYVLAFVVFLFAYSTMITWFYIGAKGVEFLAGDNIVADYLYKIIFCLFVVIGASSTLTTIIDLSDSLYFMMAIPNVIGLYILAPKAKLLLNKYVQHIDK